MSTLQEIEQEIKDAELEASNALVSSFAHVIHAAVYSKHVVIIVSESLDTFSISCFRELKPAQDFITEEVSGMGCMTINELPHRALKSRSDETNQILLLSKDENEDWYVSLNISFNLGA